MTAIVFLGDELSASGFRLAGVSVQVPLNGEEEKALEAAASRAQLVIVTEAFARRLPPALLARYRSGLHPILGVIPDIASGSWPPDRGAEIRRQLGIGAGGS